jgi:hypothetical protein
MWCMDLTAQGPRNRNDVYTDSSSDLTMVVVCLCGPCACPSVTAWTSPNRHLHTHHHHQPTACNITKHLPASLPTFLCSLTRQRQGKVASRQLPRAKEHHHVGCSRGPSGPSGMHSGAPNAHLRLEAPPKPPLKLAQNDPTPPPHCDNHLFFWSIDARLVSSSAPRVTGTTCVACRTVLYQRFTPHRALSDLCGVRRRNNLSSVQ